MITVQWYTFVLKNKILSTVCSHLFFDELLCGHVHLLAEARGGLRKPAFLGSVDGFVNKMQGVASVEKLSDVAVKSGRREASSPCYN